nr:hypothetical protein [Tanacetum cinerariifolium]
ALLSTRTGEFNPNRSIHSIRASLTGPPVKKLTVHNKGLHGNMWGGEGDAVMLARCLACGSKGGNGGAKVGDDGDMVVVVRRLRW